MRDWKILALTLAVVIGGFFSQGCTAQQRHEMLLDAKEIVINEFKEQLPKITEMVDAKVKAAIRAEQLKQYAVLDAQLEKVAKTDPDTGVVLKKTWKDFDEDKNDELSPLESGKLFAYVTKEAYGKPGGGDTIKTTGAAVAILALLGLGAKGGQALVNKVKGTSPPTDPAQPVPPPPGASSAPPSGATGAATS